MPLFGRSSPQDEQRAEQYAEWLQKRHPYAIASFVLGLFSLIEFGALLVFGLAGIVLGVMALAQLKGTGGVQEGRSDVKTQGHVLAWLGIFFSAVSLVVAALLYFRVVGG